MALHQRSDRAEYRNAQRARYSDKTFREKHFTGLVVEPFRAVSRQEKMVGFQQNPELAGGELMATNIEQELIEKVRALSPEKQQEALKLLDLLASGTTSREPGADKRRRPLWEVIEEINAQLPEDTWDQVSSDGSINLDHNLYGAPKRG